ncbi:plasmid maintenance protein (plasmid) [Borreliella sinica]|uniref:plasmid maintenance protein n=1 Tax=Borreliella sinica TaxID=87162 RepID=UPI003AEFF0B3
MQVVCQYNVASLGPRSPVLYKANISNIKHKNSKNSNINSKILKNNKTLEKKDVEDRLKKSGIENNFLYKIKDLINNESTYLNALNNLETALDEHKDSKLKYILEHFLEQFSNYRYKVWMMISVMMESLAIMILFGEKGLEISLRKRLDLAIM